MPYLQQTRGNNAGVICFDVPYVIVSSLGNLLLKGESAELLNPKNASTPVPVDTKTIRPLT